MKVNSPADIPRGNVPIAGTNGSASKSAGVVAPSNASAEVHLSNEVKDLGKNIASQEPFDEKRVAALRASIESGQYQIDSSAIADKLIASTVASAPNK